jgi:hypothetical protein
MARALNIQGNDKKSSTSGGVDNLPRGRNGINATGKDLSNINSWITRNLRDNPQANDLRNQLAKVLASSERSGSNTNYNTIANSYAQGLGLKGGVKKKAAEGNPFYSMVGAAHEGLYGDQGVFPAIGNWLDAAGEATIGNIVGAFGGRDAQESFNNAITGQDLALVPDIATDILLGPLAIAKAGIRESPNLYRAVEGIDPVTGEKVDDFQRAASAGAGIFDIGLSAIPGIGALGKGLRGAAKAGRRADELANSADIWGEGGMFRAIADDMVREESEAGARLADGSINPLHGATSDDAAWIARRDEILQDELKNGTRADRAGSLKQVFDSNTGQARRARKGYDEDVAAIENDWVPVSDQDNVEVIGRLGAQEGNLGQDVSRVTITGSDGTARTTAARSWQDANGETHWEEVNPEIWSRLGNTGSVESAANDINAATMVGVRGPLIRRDSTGKIHATPKDYNVMATPEQASQLEEALNYLSQNVEVPENNRLTQAIWNRLGYNPKANPKIPFKGRNLWGLYGDRADDARRAITPLNAQGTAVPVGSANAQNAPRTVHDAVSGMFHSNEGNAENYINSLGLNGISYANEDIQAIQDFYDAMASLRPGRGTQAMTFGDARITPFGNTAYNIPDVGENNNIVQSILDAVETGREGDELYRAYMASMGRGAAPFTPPQAVADAMGRLPGYGYNAIGGTGRGFITPQTALTYSSDYLVPGITTDSVDLIRANRLRELDDAFRPQAETFARRDEAIGEMEALYDRAMHPWREAGRELANAAFPFRPGAMPGSIDDFLSRYRGDIPEEQIQRAVSTAGNRAASKAGGRQGIMSKLRKGGGESTENAAATTARQEAEAAAREAYGPADSPAEALLNMFRRWNYDRRAESTLGNITKRGLALAASYPAQAMQAMANTGIDNPIEALSEIYADNPLGPAAALLMPMFGRTAARRAGIGAVRYTNPMNAGGIAAMNAAAGQPMPLTEQDLESNILLQAMMNPGEGNEELWNYWMAGLYDGANPLPEGFYNEPGAGLDLEDVAAILASSRYQNGPEDMQPSDVDISDISWLNESVPDFSFEDYLERLRAGA